LSSSRFSDAWSAAASRLRYSSRARRAALLLDDFLLDLLGLPLLVGDPIVDVR
jgi:hypothetical protein